MHYFKGISHSNILDRKRQGHIVTDYSEMVLPQAERSW